MYEAYTFKVAPDYTNACFSRGSTFLMLDEWSGKTLAEFSAGMDRKPGKWVKTVDAYELAGGRKIEEHTWTRSV